MLSYLAVYRVETQEYYDHLNLFSVIINRIIPLHMMNQYIFKNRSIIDWPKGTFFDNL